MREHESYLRNKVEYHEDPISSSSAHAPHGLHHGRRPRGTRCQAEKHQHTPSSTHDSEIDSQVDGSLWETRSGRLFAADSTLDDEAEDDSNAPSTSGRPWLEHSLVLMHRPILGNGPYSQASSKTHSISPPHLSSISQLLDLPLNKVQDLLQSSPLLASLELDQIRSKVIGLVSNLQPSLSCPY